MKDQAVPDAIPIKNE